MAVFAKFHKGIEPSGRHRRLRSLALAPTLMTLGNLVCGFAAVHFAMRSMFDLGAGVTDAPFHSLPQSLIDRSLPPFLVVGAVLVIVGMVFDLFDGLIARVTRSTTNFGGQLDSLADVVTFGVAPATLMVAFMSRELVVDEILPSPLSDHVIGRAAWVAAAIYVSFTAVRLARFNVEHAKADFDPRSFRGMPSPGAACVMVTLIFFQYEMGQLARSVVVYSMPCVALLLAFLMVSRIPYRRFHRAYLLGRKPFSQVMTLVLLVAVAWVIKAPTLLILVLWYAASGPLFLLVRRMQDRRRGHRNHSDDDTSDDQRQIA